MDSNSLTRTQQAIRDECVQLEDEPVYAHFYMVQGLLFFVPITKEIPKAVLGCCGLNVRLFIRVDKLEPGEEYDIVCPHCRITNILRIPLVLNEVYI